jgi:hypothetical protein
VKVSAHESSQYRIWQNLCLEACVRNKCSGEVIERYNGSAPRRTRGALPRFVCMLHKDLSARPQPIPGFLLVAPGGASAMSVVRNDFVSPESHAIGGRTCADRPLAR